MEHSTFNIQHGTFPHRSPLIPHPSSLIPHPSSLIPHPSSLSPWRAVVMTDIPLTDRDTSEASRLRPPEVADRTAELPRVNQALLAEIAERRRAEEQLRR